MVFGSDNLSTGRLAGPATLALAACLLLHGPGRAEERVLWLQGLFCNTEEQIDGALAHIGQGRPPRTAAGLVNDGGAVCTYVDRLHYAVEHPRVVGEDGGHVALVKYRATLVGVVVGGNLRAVSPPVEVFFVSPERLAGAAIERRA